MRTQQGKGRGVGIFTAVVLGLLLLGSRRPPGNGGGGATLRVDPNEAVAGTDVELTGAGFPANSEIFFTIGGIEREPLHADAQGAFVRQRNVPATLPAGNVLVVATGGGATAQATLTVTAGNGDDNGDDNGGAGSPITGIRFTGGNIRRVQTADNWPVTWAADDTQYTSWGDKVQGGRRISLGFATISGTQSNPQIRDVDTDTGKTYALLAIGNDLYTMRTPGSNVDGYKEYALWRSTNGGRSWSKNGPRWTLNEVDAIKPAFLQFGRGYTGLPNNVAGFVYAYVIEATRIGDRDRGLESQIPGRVHLMRCPVNNLMNKGSWQWFTGSANNPSWGSRGNRNNVFSQSRGVGWNLSVIYNLQLKRYILCTEFGQTFRGNLQFWDAPNPWGPWHHIDDVNLGSTVFYGNFSQKWMRNNGRTFSFVYTGIGQWDSFNVRDGTFEVD